MLVAPAAAQEVPASASSELGMTDDTLAFNANSVGQMMSGGMLAGVRDPVPMLASPRGASVFLLGTPSLYSGHASDPATGKPMRKKSLTQKLQEQNKARQR